MGAVTGVGDEAKRIHLERAPVVLPLALLVAGFMTSAAAVAAAERVFSDAAAAPAARAVVPPARPAPPPTPPTPDLAVAAVASETDCPPLPSVTFPARSTVTSVDRRALVALARWLARHPGARVVVDARRGRADRLVRVLAGAGISRRRVAVHALTRRDGANRPVSLTVAGAASCPGGSP